MYGKDDVAVGGIFIGKAKLCRNPTQSLACSYP